ncbi:MAG TPA: GAF domain-containing protein [Anaerolineae bacterium]|nr:GAF domain-containing protein [Anaerolineae bacterium]HPL28845.1 GAF domain-containing protein [Anaerolineae bacterium]
MTLDLHSLLSEDGPGSLRFSGARMALLEVEASFWALRRQMEALVGRRLTDGVLQQAGANGGASFARSLAGLAPADGAQALRDCLAALQAAGLGRFEMATLDWPIGRAVVRASDTLESWAARRHGHHATAPLCTYTAGVLVGVLNALGGRRDVVCVEHACRASGAACCTFELLPAAAANEAIAVTFDPDPFLSHQLGLLEVLSDRIPMAVAIFDRDLTLRRCNPTWAACIDRYTPISSGQVVPGARFFDLVPGTERTALPLLQRVLAGETVREDALRLESGGIVSYWDIVWQPLLDNGEVIGIVDVSTDATERVLARQGLEQRVEEHTRELSTLLEASRNLAAILEPEQLLGLVLEQIRGLVDYAGATILTLDGTDLVVRAHAGPIPQAQVLQIRFPLEAAPANREVIIERKPAIIGNVRGDEPLARAFRETAGAELETTYGYIRSWLGVPLIVHERVIGMLTLDHAQPGHYTPRHAELAMALASHAAVALDNARLYAETRRRIDETQTLFAVQQAITSQLDPNAVLQLIADEARRLTGARWTAVFTCEGDDLRVSVLSGYDDPTLLGYRMPAERSLTGRAIGRRRPLRTDDAAGDAHVNAEFVARTGLHSVLSVPLILGDRPLGAIAAADKLQGTFGEEDEWTLTMMASAAAIGLENARLYQQEQERRRESEQRRHVAEALRDTLTVLNSNRPFAEILDHIVTQAVSLLGTDACGIYRLDAERGQLTVQAACGLDPEYVAKMSFPVGMGAVGRAVLEGQPVVIENSDAAFADDDPLLQDAERRSLLRRLNNRRAVLAVPLVVRDEMYGGLVLFHPEPRRWSAEEVRLAVAIGDQAALAIENARLRAQAEETAVSAERNRLARDLHDAVTQTLFSASLIAEVLPRLWQRDAEQGRRRLEELRQLTRGALAEMRTLLLELRPSALVEAPLGDLLRQLGEAITGRARLPVTLEIEGQGDLPPDVRIAFYRIAQEALNNVAKHAGASQARLSLRYGDPCALSIADDGCGFDLGAVPADHLGLSIMRERAEAVGASLQIDSTPGRGTRVSVDWPS